MTPKSDKIFETLARGEWVHGFASDYPQVGVELRRCAGICHEINSLPPAETAGREALFRNLLCKVGKNFVIHSPFRCDFGWNISIGENFVGNFNLSILDEAPVTIGNNVFIGPNCCIATIIHAMLPEQRNSGVMRALPVTIADNVWIAASVTILPGVSIGEGAIIGAGSVVTKPIGAGMFAAGNPCREIRPVSEADRVTPVM